LPPYLRNGYAFALSAANFLPLCRPAKGMDTYNMIVNIQVR